MKILAILLLVLLCGCQQKTERINEHIRDAYNATCRVQNLLGTGTGVLLETGYVVTAAHVVDFNKDGKIDIDESVCNWVQFDIDGKQETRAAEVVLFGEWSKKDSQDIAILRVINPPPSKIRLATPEEYEKYLYGDKVFTIGATNAGPMRVTDGRLDNHYSPETNLDRTTCDIYMGNSGGGIFSEDGLLLGIAIQLHIDYLTTQIEMAVPIPGDSPDEMSLVFASGMSHVPHLLSDWSEFVNAKGVRYLASIYGRIDMVRKDKSISYWQFQLAVFLNLFLIFVLYKHGKPFVQTLLR